MRSAIAKPAHIDFFVRYPWGGNYMEQLMPALDRLNQPWIADPSAEGGDDYRIFLAMDRRLLRKAVKIIEQAYERANELDSESGDESDTIIDDAESHVLYDLGVSSIAQDWKHWDWEDDVLVLAQLGIQLRVTELPKAVFRVRLKRTSMPTAVREIPRTRKSR